MQINQVSVEFTVCAAAGFLSSPAPVVSPVWRLDRVRPCGSSGKHKTPTMHLCPGSLPLMWTRRRPAGWNPKNHRRHSSVLSRRFPEVQTTYRHTADIKRSSLFWKHLKHSVQRQNQQNQQNQRHKSLSVSSSLQSQRLCVVSWQYLWDRLKPLTDPTDDGQNRLRGRRFDSLQLTGPTGWTRPPGRQSTLSDGNAAGVKMWRLRLWEHFTSLIRRHGSEVGFLHRDLWAKQTLRHKDVSCQWAARPGTRESHKTDRRAEGLRKVQARRKVCVSGRSLMNWAGDLTLQFHVSEFQLCRKQQEQTRHSTSLRINTWSHSCSWQVKLQVGRLVRLCDVILPLSEVWRVEFVLQVMQERFWVRWPAEDMSDCNSELQAVQLEFSCAVSYMLMLACLIYWSGSTEVMWPVSSKGFTLCWNEMKTLETISDFRLFNILKLFTSVIILLDITSSFLRHREITKIFIIYLVIRENETH